MILLVALPRLQYKTYSWTKNFDKVRRTNTVCSLWVRMLISSGTTFTQIYGRSRSISWLDEIDYIVMSGVVALAKGFSLSVIDQATLFQTFWGSPQPHCYYLAALLTLPSSNCYKESKMVTLAKPNAFRYSPERIGQNAFETMDLVDI